MDAHGQKLTKELSPIIHGIVSSFLFITMTCSVITLTDGDELFAFFVSRAMSGESPQTFTMWSKFSALVAFVALLAIVVPIDSMRK